MVQDNFGSPIFALLARLDQCHQLSSAPYLSRMFSLFSVFRYFVVNLFLFAFFAVYKSNSSQPSLKLIHLFFTEAQNLFSVAVVTESCNVLKTIIIKGSNSLLPYSSTHPPLPLSLSPSPSPSLILHTPTRLKATGLRPWAYIC